MIYHWHARTLEYIVLKADDLDALSIITSLRQGVRAALMTPFHENWKTGLNVLKVHLKKGTLTPMRAFNLVAGLCDNPELPQQHGWSRTENTVLECVMNNLQFNNILNYTIGWPTEFTDDPKDLAPGEVPSEYKLG